MKKFLIFFAVTFSAIAPIGIQALDKKPTILSYRPPHSPEKIFSHEWPVLDLAFSSDEQLVATLSDNNYRWFHPKGSSHRTIYIRDRLGKKTKKILVSDSTSAIAFSPCNKLYRTQVQMTHSILVCLEFY